MELRIPRAVVADIEAHALALYPEECCGFLVGQEDGPVRVVTMGRRARNVDPGPRTSRYTIDPRDVLQVDREFRGDVRHVGFYHSHPGYAPEPSAFDLRRAWPYYVYAILAVSGKEPQGLTAWQLDPSAQAFLPVAVTVLA